MVLIPLKKSCFYQSSFLRMQRTQSFAVRGVRVQRAPLGGRGGGGRAKGPHGLPGPVAWRLLFHSLCLRLLSAQEMGNFQEWTLKASSCSECMLLSERRSGSLSSSLVKMADSLGWFLVMRLRRARISVSCRASTEFTFSMPERSERAERESQE